MNREELIEEYRRGRLDRETFVRRARAAGFSLAGALTLAGALASVAEAGVSAQHNETLIRL